MGKDQERALLQESLAAGSLETVTVSACSAPEAAGSGAKAGRLGDYIQVIANAVAAWLPPWNAAPVLRVTRAGQAPGGTPAGR
jgi:hypothetical protein